MCTVEDCEISMTILMDSSKDDWGTSHRNVGKQDLLMAWMCFRDRQLLSSPRLAALAQLLLDSQL